MKRDMELIRLILLDIEERGKPSIGEDTLIVEISTYAHDQIDYQLFLLHEAGLIDAKIISNPSVQTDNRVRPRRLTWEGHEYLDTIRDPEIWQKTKQGADAVRSWSFETIKDIGKGLIKKQIEEWAGVKVG